MLCVDITQWVGHACSGTALYCAVLSFTTSLSVTASSSFLLLICLNTVALHLIGHRVWSTISMTILIHIRI